MPVKRKKPKARKEVDADLWRILTDSAEPHDNTFSVNFWSGQRLREAWTLHGEDALAQFIGQRPGRRPRAWWLFDAPERRQRVGGGPGTPLDATPTAFSNTYNLRLGVPDQWVTPFWARFLELRVPMIDADNPPRYESQPAYLKRLGLLTSAELKRLTAADFESQTIFQIGILSEEDLHDDD